MINDCYKVFRASIAMFFAWVKHKKGVDPDRIVEELQENLRKIYPDITFTVEGRIDSLETPINERFEQLTRTAREISDQHDRQLQEIIRRQTEVNQSMPDFAQVEVTQLPRVSQTSTRTLVASGSTNSITKKPTINAEVVIIRNKKAYPGKVLDVITERKVNGDLVISKLIIEEPTSETNYGQPDTKHGKRLITNLLDEEFAETCKQENKND